MMNSDHSKSSTHALVVLYLDVDGVLQYAKDGAWEPRPEAEAFLEWAVQTFECRWLTNWFQPNKEIPRQFGIRVPAGIAEVKWRVANRIPLCKAAAISDAEPWLWLEDEPSEYDWAELKRRKMGARLIQVDPNPQTCLLTKIRPLLEERRINISAR